MSLYANRETKIIRKKSLTFVSTCKSGLNKFKFQIDEKNISQKNCNFEYYNKR